jgi:hypothetical protein
LNRISILMLGALSILFAVTPGCKNTDSQGVPKTPAAKPDGSLAAAVVDPQVSNCNITPPDTAITPKLLTSGLPCEATITKPFTLNNIQRGFDYYSWLTFLALNAPSDGNTPIGHGPGKGGDAPTQWEEWKELFEVMLPDGKMPNPWSYPRAVPQVCQKLSSDPGTRIVRMVGKTPDVLDEVVQPFDTGPLIDQYGNYTRYEILMNRPMFEYIAQNNLYNKQGQAKFAGMIRFPEGKVVDKIMGAVGAIMVKAAWKVLGSSDDPGAFHTDYALVYTPPSTDPKIEESCHKARLGLVGLHIGHKTKADPQWIWSTFEHVNNVPTEADVTANSLRKSYNFYRPGCPTTQCLVNVPPPRPWDPNIEPFPNGFTSQITRVIPIATETQQLNAGFNSILENTVWQNYVLVSTQWPTQPTSKTDPTGVPAPVFLANTTMETYVQGTVPQASSSCIGCHNNAATTSGRPSDFTYILERAR